MYTCQTFSQTPCCSNASGSACNEHFGGLSRESVAANPLTLSSVAFDNISMTVCLAALKNKRRDFKDKLDLNITDACVPSKTLETYADGAKMQVSLSFFFASVVTVSCFSDLVCLR